MRELPFEVDLAALIDSYDKSGGVLDYVLLQADVDGPAGQLHRAAAIEAMRVLDSRLEQLAHRRASPQHPASAFFRLRWDETRLKGHDVSFATFWGRDDLGNSWSVDGYKSAFFLPPYGIYGMRSEDAQELFLGINGHLFCADPSSVEIFSWSTDWSNYFDAGHEWWGAFFWTIRRADPRQFVVIGASSTD